MRFLAAILACGCILGYTGPGWAWTVPATGITTCYDQTGAITCPTPGQAFYGQNGNYPGQPHVFTDGGVTVTDQTTGLTWQKTPDDTARNLDDALAYCVALDLGGFGDWRLPHQRELVTLINHAASKPAFPEGLGGASGHYWSDTLYVGYGGAAWYVNYAYGVSEFNATAEGRLTRCVRGATLADSVFTAQANHVTDATTELVWEKAPSASGMTWEQALAYCENQATDGYGDWRLPSVMELRTLVAYGQINPAIDTTKFQETGVTYWTGSTCDGYPDLAWSVDFASGVSANGDKTSNSSHARCVRGGVQVQHSSAPLYKLILLR